MFIYILVLALTLPTKEVPFSTFAFLEQHKTAISCKAAAKELTEGYSKEQSERVFCIAIKNQAAWSADI